MGFFLKVPQNDHLFLVLQNKADSEPETEHFNSICFWQELCMDGNFGVNLRRFKEKSYRSCFKYFVIAHRGKALMNNSCEIKGNRLLMSVINVPSIAASDASMCCLDSSWPVWRLPGQAIHQEEHK
ncbi:hypothetical protein CDAR_561191 [Caerostris darwini]|uniref:Uncharacterized protein n=1 Tax=Caerostris darwini TaxID=1538125 RepID=A0AAV4TG89_9ARAC|nr:hypothetical protein CDAR_561191 [Caerostris darwini]